MNNFSDWCVHERRSHTVVIKMQIELDIALFSKGFFFWGGGNAETLIKMIFFFLLFQT